MAYVSEFLYRGRDPQHEAGKAADYHVVIADWQKGPDGYRPLYSAALTPAQAENSGFPLDTILKEVAAAAIMRAEQAEAIAKSATADRDAAHEAKVAAEKERDEAIDNAAKAAQAALDARETAVRISQEANAFVDAAQAQAAQASAALESKLAKAISDKVAAQAETLETLKRLVQMDEIHAAEMEEATKSPTLLNRLTFGLMDK